MKKQRLHFEVAYPTIEEVLYIHEQVVEKFGGSHGVRDMNLAEERISAALQSKYCIRVFNRCN